MPSDRASITPSQRLASGQWDCLLPKPPWTRQGTSLSISNSIRNSISISISNDTMILRSCHLIHYLSAMVSDLDRDLSMLLLIDFFVSTRRHWFEKSPQASSQVLSVPGTATNRRWDARPDYFRFFGTQSANPRNPRFVGSSAFRWDVVGLSAIKICGIAQPVVSDWILRSQSCDAQATWENSLESEWNLHDL